MRARIRAISLLLAGAAVLALCGPAATQVVGPPPPPRYQVELRYRIDAPPTNRVPQFHDFVRALEAAGFEKDPGPEDEAADRTLTGMTGKVASKRARGLLDVRRVHRLLLIPEGFKPAEAKQPVVVVLELAERFGLARQRRLAEQVLGLLAKEGFREDVGYDNRGHTHLVGRVPYEKVPRLLLDLRGPDRDKLDEPLRSAWPVRLVEVRPEPEGVPPPREPVVPPAPPKDQPHLLKLSPELQRAVREAPDRLARLEVLLTDPALAAEPATRRELPRTGDVVDIEYAMDLFVVLVAPLRTAPQIAKLPFVQAVRFPQPPSPMVTSAPVAANALEQAKRAWSVEAMHRAGCRGRGVRLAVISDDFRSYSRHVGKGLPGATRLIDLTAERDPSLEPDPMPGDPAGVGQGTLQALAAAEAAPEAELILVRIGTDSAHQLREVARYLAGETTPSPALRRRVEEMREEEERLRRMQDELLEERRRILEMLPAADDAEGRKRREAYFKRQKEWDTRDEALRQRRQRYLRYQDDLKLLRSVRIAACGLVWNDGYPVNGTGPLARRLAGWPRRCTLWAQAVGDTGGQAWAGMFRDEDGNGKMEFAAPTAPLPARRWSAELNFLAWQPHAGARVLDLPAGAVVQLAVQWSEAHDGLLRRLGEDAYRRPLASLGFVVLRQRDPEGKLLPSDAMEVVARSAPADDRVVRRLHVAANSSVYEHTLVFSVPVAGRYAVQVEGSYHLSIRPAGDETLPALVRSWELRPRLFVQALDADSRRTARPVWFDHGGGEGAVGTPADAGMVVTVGASDAAGQRRPYSPHGSPLGMRLLSRPDLLLRDGIVPGGVTGTAISTGFAAGVAASAITAGGGAETLRQTWKGDERKGWVLPGSGDRPR